MLRLPLVVLALAGCSSIDYGNRVEGWPAMRVEEHRVSIAEVQDRCRKYVGAGQWPLACAEYYFPSRCVIWYAWEWTLEHERAHCAGYEHAGERSMAAMLRQWRAQ